MLETIFPRGRVIPSEDVISRNGFVRELEERLFLGDSTALISHIRTGKTTLGLEVLQRLKDRGCHTIYIDLLPLLTLDQVALQMTRQIQGIPSYCNDKSPNEKDAIPPVYLLEQALKNAELVAGIDGKRMIILWDEWHHIVRLGDHLLVKRLRSIFEHQSNVTHLFVGSHQKRMITMFADLSQPLYRFATILHLPTITSGEWEAYVHGKLARARCAIDQDAFAKLIRVTGGHPYCVMVVLQHVETELGPTHNNHVDLSVMESSINRAFAMFDALYSVILSQVLEIQGAGEVLVALSKGQFRDSNDGSIVKKALSQLVNISVLTRQKRGEYQFVEEMFREWLMRKPEVHTC